jgi:hypothetical protein
MEEQYELISKQSLLNLKEENKKLKEDLKSQNKTTTLEKNSFQEQFLVDIKQMLEKKHDEEKKELFSQLNEIKELNKSTLDNVLHKTQGLDLRLEDMIDTLKGLVSTISEVIENEPQQQNTSQMSSVFENEIAKITIKLEDVETFMKNLRILLSYLEPTKATLNKPQIPSLDNTPIPENKELPPTLNL